MPTPDLPALGAALRTRRRSLRIPSAELARRIEISPTYVWLVERAKERSSGEPSRPSEELLLRWTRALGMHEEEARHLLALAGYFEVDREASRGPRSQVAYTPERRTERRAGAAIERPAAEESASLGAMLDLVLASDSSEAGSRVWRRSDAEKASVEQEFIERVTRLLRDAHARGREEEVQRLLDSYLRWLRFALEHER
jgi:transcriptional regulator with XRE-family HTH domain